MCSCVRLRTARLDAKRDDERMDALSGLEYGRHFAARVGGGSGCRERRPTLLPNIRVVDEGLSRALEAANDA